MSHEAVTPPQTNPLDHQIEAVRLNTAEAIGFDVEREATQLSQEQTEALLADFPVNPTGPGDDNLLGASLTALDKANVDRVWIQNKLVSGPKRVDFNNGTNNVLGLMLPYETKAIGYFEQKGVSQAAADEKLGMGLKIAETMAGVRERTLSVRPQQISEVRVFNHKGTETPAVVEYVLPTATGVDIHAMRFFGRDNHEAVDAQVALVRN